MAKQQQHPGSGDDPVSKALRLMIAAYHERWLVPVCATSAGYVGSLVDAAERALAQQPAKEGPAGWKLVPVEPTPKMVKAGARCASSNMVYHAMLAAAPAAPVAQTAAARDVLAERQRQVSVEGWTPEHDDKHQNGSMAVAAACYAAWGLPSRPASETVAALWPWTGWAQKWFKPKDTRHNLVRAGALILAEIERLDRAGQTP